MADDVMILEAFKSKAPPMPIFSAKYRAIYFEPINGSGELFTIGIMAQAETGEISVIQTLPDQSIQCMYGNKSEGIKKMVSIILESAKNYLLENLPIEQWEPPMTGTMAGDIQKSYSNNGMEGILFQGISSYSSLCFAYGQMLDDTSAKIKPKPKPKLRIHGGFWLCSAGSGRIGCGLTWRIAYENYMNQVGK